MAAHPVQVEYRQEPDAVRRSGRRASSAVATNGKDPELWDKSIRACDLAGSAGNSIIARSYGQVVWSILSDLIATRPAVGCAVGAACAVGCAAVVCESERMVPTISTWWPTCAFACSPISSYG